MSQHEGGFELKDNDDGLRVVKNNDFMQVLFQVEGNRDYIMSWSEAERLAKFILEKMGPL